MQARPSSRDFVERIMRITPPYSNAFGFAGIAAISSSGADIVQHLRQQAIQFGRAYDKPRPNSQLIQQLADKLEAELRNVQVMGLLSDNEARHLNSQLEELLTNVVDYQE